MSRLYLRSMVLEIQLFLIHAFQRVVAPCFRELGPYKSKKNNCISRTMTCDLEKGGCDSVGGESVGVCAEERGNRCACVFVYR